MSAAIEPLAYTVASAAEACHLSPKTIRDAINALKLPAHKSGVKVVILADDLREWLRSLPAARD